MFASDSLCFFQRGNFLCERGIVFGKLPRGLEISLRVLQLICSSFNARKLRVTTRDLLEKLGGRKHIRIRHSSFKLRMFVK